MIPEMLKGLAKFIDLSIYDTKYTKPVMSMSDYVLYAPLLLKNLLTSSITPGFTSFETIELLIGLLNPQPENRLTIKQVLVHK